jgi:hypothetical protein
MSSLSIFDGYFAVLRSGRSMAATTAHVFASVPTAAAIGVRLLAVAHIYHGTCLNFIL